MNFNKLYISIYRAFPAKLDSLFTQEFKIFIRLRLESVKQRKARCSLLAAKADLLLQRIIIKQSEISMGISQNISLSFSLSGNTTE